MYIITLNAQIRHHLGKGNLGMAAYIKGCLRDYLLLKMISSVTDCSNAMLHYNVITFCLGQKKKNVLFPETLPTLLFGAYSKFFWDIWELSFYF